MEQLLHSPEGSLLTRGPGAYKIPSFNDVPAKFNVCLLRGASNPRAVYSSKAVGEPPLFLAASVFWAIKVGFFWKEKGNTTTCRHSDIQDAVRSARTESEASSEFQLESPATAERIRHRFILVSFDSD